MQNAPRMVSPQDANCDVPRRLAILSAPGSRGDVNPMIAIGRRLRDRGYDVAIALAEPYAHLAEAAGLDAYPLVDRQQFDDLLSDPSTWKLLRGMRNVIRGIAADFLTPHFELIKRLHRPGRTVLVSHPLDFGARIFRDLVPETPLVDIHLAPVMLRVPNQPARLTSWRFEPTRHLRTFRLAYWLGDAIVLDPLLAKPINRIRRQHGLASVRRVMQHWWLSPDRVLACYPEWFAPSTVGVLPQLRHVGFPLDDVSNDPFDAPSDRPIVFTGGTANWHTRTFFSQAARVCERLGRGGLLLGNHPNCFPNDLPSSVRPQSYAPLGKLLPDCVAIVHHGGIGTTSQALRAGIPQVIRPMAFDQHDNAARVVALGCGVCLQNGEDLATALQFVLNETSIGQRLRDLSPRWQVPSGAVAAAEAIDAVATDRIGAA